MTEQNDPRFWIRIERDPALATEDSPYSVFGYHHRIDTGALAGSFFTVRFPARPKLYRTVAGAQATAKHLGGEGRTVTVKVWKGAIE